MSNNYRPPQKDERLVMFLQQFRPSPPPAPLDSEERLFLLLDRPEPVGEARESTAPPARVRSWRRWILPAGTLALGSLFAAWGNYHIIRAPQIAERRAEEIEEFIVRSWEGFAPVPTDTLRSFEAEWLLHQENVGVGPTGADAASFDLQAEPASYP